MSSVREREGKKTNRGAFKRQAQQSVICSVIEAEQNPGLDGGATNGSVPLLSAAGELNYDALWLLG